MPYQYPARPLPLLISCSLLVALLTSQPAWGFSSTAPKGAPSRFRLSTRQQHKTTLLSSSSKGGEGGTQGVLFDDYGESSSRPKSQEKAKFGESVPLKRPASESSFGESVPLRRQSDESTTANSGDLFSALDTTSDDDQKSKGELQKMKERNIIVTILSLFFAVSTYLWQYTHPITPVQLLATMQSNSAPLTSIGTNGRPTVVDFWAPWCENCKTAAPTLQKVEEEYKDQVNFVMVNGDRPEAWPLIERFGVDAIPHLALVSADGDVETALIGPITKRVLEEDLNVLVSNANNGKEGKMQLPYTMMDAFANRPNDRRVHFDDESMQNK